MAAANAVTANLPVATLVCGDWLSAAPELLQSFERSLGGCQRIDLAALTEATPTLQCLLLGAEQLDLSHPGGREQMQRLAQGYLLVVVLAAADSAAGSDYFRLGAVDVVAVNDLDTQVQAVVARLHYAVQERGRALAYSEQLESANRQLQESLQLLKQDHLAGLEVQKSLMPDSPLQFGDYQISHAVRPSLYLSGDFVGYNFVLDRYLLFYFADVSGHGASSAFVTVLLRFMIGRVIRRHTYERDYQALARAPEGLVEHINSQLLATGLGKHLTLFAGSLDLHSNTLRYVVGAQLPPPLLIADNRASYLPGKGRPAGIFEQASWQVEEVELPENSSLLLLSDGVLDFVEGDNLVAKEQQLLAQLQGPVESLDELQDRLGISYVDELQDDVSMLLLQRKPRQIQP